MFPRIIIVCCCLYSGFLFAQPSDYLLVKKKNGVVLKTLYEGSFISAVTYEGTRLNGVIRRIHNDSLLLLQQDVRLVPTALGTRVDTVAYLVRILYTQVQKINFERIDLANRSRGFTQLKLPKLLMIMGYGFTLLELFNTAYRSDPLLEKKELSTLAVSTGVGLSGTLWSLYLKRRNRVGGRYTIEYIPAASLK
ncbi:MAG: hypothetical protein ACKO6K_06515 [Chitinophagaceae bacterium]